MTEPAGTVASLFRFPVKSMQGESIEACEISESGLAGDRSYAVMDKETGKLASAKLPRKWAALLRCRAGFAEPPSASRPAPPVRIELPDGRITRSDDEGADRVLSEFLGRTVTLVTRAPEGAVFEEYWPEVKGGEPYGLVQPGDGEVVTDVPASGAAPAGTLFDFSALHLLTTSTLEGLRAAYPAGRFDVRRFRPNIVLDVPDGEVFVENEWRSRVLSSPEGLRFKVIIPTPRCVMTTLAQDDLPNDLGILRAASDANRIRAGGLGALPCAGVYAAVLEGGTIRRGDPIDLEPPDVRA